MPLIIKENGDIANGTPAFMAALADLYHYRSGPSPSDVTEVTVRFGSRKERTFTFENTKTRFDVSLSAIIEVEATSAKDAEDQIADRLDRIDGLDYHVVAKEA